MAVRDQLGQPHSRAAPQCCADQFTKHTTQEVELHSQIGADAILRLAAAACARDACSKESLQVCLAGINRAEQGYTGHRPGMPC